MSAHRSRSGAHCAATLVALVGLSLAVSHASGATIVTSAPTGHVLIDFNTLGINANNGEIQTYLQGIVDGTTISGAGASGGYDGEGYVVGDRINGVVKSFTLGTTDGGVYHGGFDNFIVNPSGSDRFTLDFAHTIYGVSFDFEIFPNGSVPDGSNPNHKPFPDFTFKALLVNGAVETLVNTFHVVSVMPGSAYSPDGTLQPDPHLVTFSSSPNHSLELAPQFLGSASFVFPGGVNRLVFIDWPERIGIDNLDLDFGPAQPQSDPSDPTPTPTHTPEPSTLVLMGTLFGALGLGFIYRQQRNSQAAIAHARV